MTDAQPPDASETAPAADLSHAQADLAPTDGDGDPKPAESAFPNDYMARYYERLKTGHGLSYGYTSGGQVGGGIVGERGPELTSINDFADPNRAVPALRQVEAWSVANRAAITEDCHDCEVHAWFGGDLRVVTRFCDRHRPKETT